MEEPRKRDKKKSKTKQKGSHSVKDASSVYTGSSSAGDDERRRAKLIRSAEQHEKRMAELGLDVNGEPLDNYSLSKYPVREWKLALPGLQDHIALNPFVTMFGIVCLWSFVGWVAHEPTGAMLQLSTWRDAIATQLSSLLQFSNAIGFFFLLYVAYKYGHIHLGQSDEKPEFSFLTTLVMILAAGTGPGFLIYGAAEPLIHSFGNFYAQAGYRSQDEIALFAVNMTVFRWGILSWTRCALVAVCVALAGHRFRMPLTLRSCFYPILGAYTWGWMGDVLDGMAIVSALVGSCLIMTFSIVQLVVCFMYLEWMDTDSTKEDIAMMQNVTIWVITILSTASVISGLRGGVRFFSRTALAFCTLLLLLVLIMDDTKFLLNLQVQEVGYHLQTSIFQLSFWTDAFGQLRPGEGRAIDSKASDPLWYNSIIGASHAASIALGTGVGLFSAHVCRGRSLLELIVLCLLAPSVYFLVWFCTFGGVGLRQVRQAAELAVLGATYFNNSAHFLADGSQFCFDVPQEDVVVGDTTVFTNFLPGVTPVCTVDVASINTVSLNVLSSFRFGDSFGSNGLGPTLVTIFVLACVLTLISSSDSSSLIVDSLSSNARKNYHWLRRLFWASTVGAVSMALLALAETSSMKVVEAFVAVCTLPMAIAVCFMFQSIILFCKAADSQNAIEGDAGTYEYRIPDQPEFAMPVYGGILNSIEYLVSFGKVNAARIELGMHRATTVHVVEFLKGVVVPFASLNQVLGQTYPQNPKTNAIVVAIYALCYLAWFGIFAASWTYPGATGLMWTFFAVNGCILSIVRSSFRKHYNLRSNAFADLTGSMFLWPQVLAQLRVQCAVGPAMGNNKRTEDNNKDEYIDEPRVDTGNRHEDNGNDEDEDAYA